MSEIIRENIAEGVTFSTIPSEKFKTTRISVKFYVPLKKESVYLNSLVCKILVRSCNKYPSLTELSKYLSSIYGASLSSSISKIGDMQVLSFTVSGIDDRYTIDREIISDRLSGVLCDVIFDPKVLNGCFDKTEINQSKRELKESIDAEFNDKRVYAMRKAVSYMCDSEPYGISLYGSKDEIDKAKDEEIFNAWKNMIENSKVEIVFSGGCDPIYAKNSFKEYFLKNIRKTEQMDTIVIRKAEKVRKYSENMPLSQSKLIMGFRTDCAQPDDDTYVLKLMCTVLGGSAHSKLFMNVREKQSLCYYCSSKSDSFKGLMFVESGVEKENIEKTEKAVLKEIEDIKNGDVTDDEIKAAKLTICNTFRESKDLSTATEVWYTGQFFSKEILSVEQACERIESVTKDDIIKAARKLTFDTVYTLVGDGEEV